MLRKASTHHPAATATAMTMTTVTRRKDTGVISILLHSLASSGMTTKAISKAAWPVNPLRFLAKPSHKVIVHRFCDQHAALFDTVTIPARAGSRSSKNKIAVRIGDRISAF
jgi:hypothetical protein